MKIINLTLTQWAAIPDCPIQRDTEMRAVKASRGHLNKRSQTQNLVFAACLPNGSMIKLDGHTRCFLWEQKKLPLVGSIQCCVYDVASIEDALDLYKHFDNSAAAENSQDKLTGAYKLHGITPQSSLLTKGGITSALQAIHGSSKIDIYEMVRVWKTELMLIDSLGANKRSMQTPLIAAALLTLRKRGGSAGMEFWRKYLAKDGSRINGKSDGVDQLLRSVETAMASNTITGGSEAIAYFAGKAVSCFEAYYKGATFKIGAKSTDIASYL